ncbi:hypothetical protein LNAOJCKE_2972 [Methylorubrum aminovorans]|uniref:Uncharacterized protein n=1 Tax=Methylorubrum aminovorans TaxID=269069 RepID=A0ABQ4UEL0_9HYPH|nr:hypothetical protein [Methylorubrum aminovorans]GJE65759.1 hypothetical protein LNAOJCKE_2972 [Methylorubrum aminovorans]GMA75891.1 hypothetical protein GCM10025880_23080 [Methylorubrum aminovorans]
MPPEIIIGDAAIISSGAFFLHSLEKMATISLDDAAFIIHVFDPEAGESAPQLNVDSNTGAHAFMPKSFAMMQFGPGGKYGIRVKVDHAFERGNGLYLVHYSVHHSYPPAAA